MSDENKKYAKSFAQRWYGRMEAGMDEPTLACLLEGLLDRIERETLRKEHDRMMARLRHILTGRTT